MKRKIYKYVTLFIWSPIIAPLYFWFLTCVQIWMPKSSIDGSTVIGNVVLTSMQVSNIMIISFFIVDAILQAVLIIVYKKWGAFSGKFTVVKVVCGAIISYVIFLLIAFIALGISYSYTMSNFH